MILLDSSLGLFDSSHHGTNTNLEAIPQGGTPDFFAPKKISAPKVDAAHRRYHHHHHHHHHHHRHFVYQISHYNNNLGVGGGTKTY